MRVGSKQANLLALYRTGILLLLLGMGGSESAQAMRVKQRSPEPPSTIKPAPLVPPIQKPPPRHEGPRPAPPPNENPPVIQQPLATSPSLRIGLSLNQKSGLSQFLTSALQTEGLTGFRVFDLATGKLLGSYPPNQAPFTLAVSIVPSPSSEVPAMTVRVRSSTAPNTGESRLIIPLRDRTPEDLLQGIRLVGTSNTGPLWRLANKSLYGQPLQHSGILDLVAPIGPKDTAQAALQGLVVVNQVDLETYLKGVLPYEMAPSFPLEALKAQAIVARTFALQSRIKKWRWFDHPDTTLSQVYGGLPWPSNAIIDQAVEQTRGVVLTHQQQPIQAYFHSTSGGVTATDRQFAPLDAEKLAQQACRFHLGTQPTCHEVQTPDTPSQPYLTPRPDTFQWPTAYQNLGDSRQLTQLLRSDNWGLSSFERGSRLFRWEFSWPTDLLKADLFQQLVQLSRTHPKAIWPTIRGGETTFGELEGVIPIIRTPYGRIMLLHIVTQQGDWFVAGDGPIRQVLRQPDNGKPLPSNWFVCNRELTLPASPPPSPQMAVPLPLPVSSPMPSLISPSATAIHSRITCQGGGFGHGVGLSQYGAYGMAQAGQTAGMIIRHYFPTVQLTTLPSMTGSVATRSPN